LQSLAIRSDRWTPPIVKAVASDGTGISDLVAAISDYEAYLQEENLVLQHSIENWQERLIEMLRDALLDKAREQMQDGDVTRYAADVAEHKRDPYTLVEEIVGKMGKG
jgi:LAO/AO transport system kinase